MILAARALSGLVSLILIYLGLRYLFAPDTISEFIQLTPDSSFGEANIRAMAAPLLMLGIVNGIGAAKTAYQFLVPAAVYFLVLILTRIISLVANGVDTATIRALVLAVIFFAVTEFAVQIVKRARKVSDN